MKKFFAALCAFSILFSLVSLSACRESKRYNISTVTTGTAAAIPSYIVVKLDNFDNNEEQEIRNNINIQIKNTILVKGPFKKRPLRITCTKKKVKPRRTGYNLLCWVGKYRKCPDLYKLLQDLRDAEDRGDD